MYRKCLWLLLIILPTVMGCTAFYYQSPYTKFNHEKHVDVLFQQQKDCFFCHKMPSADTFMKQGDSAKVTPELKIDGKCHSCHRDPDTRVAKAPHKCSTCHDNMKVLKPADHVKNWKEVHAVPASMDSKKCATCHSQWYCENCHSKVHSVDKYRHPRSFKLKHSMEAMIDPGSCDTCHRVEFCIKCHRKD